MKRIMALLAAALLLAGCGGGAAPSSGAQSVADSSGAGAGSVSAPAAPGTSGVFTVTSSGIAEGVIGDAYGMRGSQQQDGVPTRSLPFVFQNPPDGTVCYALVMDDPDAEELAGYVWVHWLAANITAGELAENASIEAAEEMVQGQNSWGTTGYGGPTPPNKPHTYVVTVYALDAELPLAAGFTADELRAAMEGHVLQTASLQGSYSN